MTTETIDFAFSGAATRYGGSGRIWYIKTATTPIDITCRKSGSGSTNVRSFRAMSAGTKFKAEIGDGWDTLEITSSAAQIVTLVIGDDDVEVASAVVVTGNVTTIDQPAVDVTDRAPVVAATGAQSTLFAQNLARRRLRVYADSQNAGSCYVRRIGAANNIGELMPGGIYDYSGLYGLDVRNDTGAAATFYIFEEL